MYYYSVARLFAIAFFFFYLGSLVHLAVVFNNNNLLLCIAGGGGGGGGNEIQCEGAASSSHSTSRLLPPLASSAAILEPENVEFFDENQLHRAPPFPYELHFVKTDLLANELDLTTTLLLPNDDDDHDKVGNEQKNDNNNPRKSLLLVPKNGPKLNNDNDRTVSNLLHRCDTVKVGLTNGEFRPVRLYDDVMQNRDVDPPLEETTVLSPVSMEIDLATKPVSRVDRDFSRVDRDFSKPSSSSSSSSDQCLMLVAQPTFDTNQIFQWKQRDGHQQSATTADPENLVFLENPHIRDELEHYLSNFQRHAKELSAVLEQQGNVKSNDNNNNKKKKKKKDNTKSTIILMGTGTNYSDWTQVSQAIVTYLAQSWASSSSLEQQPGKNNLGNAMLSESLSSVQPLLLLVLCLDRQCHNFVQEHRQSAHSAISVQSFFSPKWVGPGIVQSEEKRMLAQTYASQLILHLGHDLIFLETAIAPSFLSLLSQNEHMKEWLDRGVLLNELTGRTSTEQQQEQIDNIPYDICFSATATTSINTKLSRPQTGVKEQQQPKSGSDSGPRISAPWLVNSRRQVLHVKSNAQTKYLWSRLVVSMDQFLFFPHGHNDISKKAWDAVLSQLIWEQVSLFGLRHKIVPPL